jgi:hypothetical protein
MFQQTVKKLGDDTIFVKPICEFFELAYDNQVINIKNDRILSTSTGKKPCKTMFGDNYPRLYLSKKGFVRWVQIINPNVIAPHLKEKFEQYQELLFDYIYGSIENEREMKRTVIRLNKLEKLYSKIGLEIKKEKANQYKYINNRFLPVQTSLTFPESKAIAEINQFEN